MGSKRPIGGQGAYRRDTILLTFPGLPTSPPQPVVCALSAALCVMGWWGIGLGEDCVLWTGGE